MTPGLARSPSAAHVLAGLDQTIQYIRELHQTGPDDERNRRFVQALADLIYKWPAFIAGHNGGPSANGIIRDLRDFLLRYGRTEPQHLSLFIKLSATARLLELAA